MDIAELRVRIEQHLSVAALDESIASHLRSLADWIEGKQAEEAEADGHIAWLQSHGYTVTK